MNLKQLQLVCEMVKNDYNVSRTAEALFSTQPGISTQLKSLEDELNVKLFKRKGKRITGLSEAGEKVFVLAEETLHNVKTIKQIGLEHSSKDSGQLSIATTHTQARYALPKVIKKFSENYPNVTLQIHQGSPTQISEMVIHGEADFAIATEGLAKYDKLAILPVYKWNRCVIAPIGHPILETQKLTLDEIAKYPIVTYDYAFAGRSVIDKAFAEHQISPNIVLTAIDSDVIKTYVGIGLGIGLLANMAYDKDQDTSLKRIDASHLFDDNTTCVGFRKGQFIREYMYDFLLWFSSDLTRDAVIEANQK